VRVNSEFSRKPGLFPVPLPFEQLLDLNCQLSGGVFRSSFRRPAARGPDGSEFLYLALDDFFRHAPKDFVACPTGVSRSPAILKSFANELIGVFPERLNHLVAAKPDVPNQVIGPSLRCLAKKQIT
jgi:hypothetical protein